MFKKTKKTVDWPFEFVLKHPEKHEKLCQLQEQGAIYSNFLELAH